MPDTTTHPTDEAIGTFALGMLDPPESRWLEEHLAECALCQDRAEAVPPDTLVQLLASARIRADAGRSAAPTPSLLASTTQAWVDGASGPTDGADLPAALAGHPKYRPVRRLGTGGMGTVWLAEHAVMNRPVAVKVVRPDLLARHGAADRFLREVRAAARLHHPNIVAAFDAELAGDSCLLVMEYVRGETLADRLAAGPLPLTEACRAARDAARGLAHAHAAGLVHRDVKPHNLIRAADGTVKVLDFGLAGVAAGETGGRGGDGLTGAGMLVGTADYIAPEQAADPRAADPRADIYGLGCTLYHLLAGRPPVPPGSVAEKLAAHRERTPDPVPGLPPDLAAVLARMLAKRPEDRYQTAVEVLAALEPFTAEAAPGAGTAARKTRTPPRRRLALAAGLLFAAVAAAGGVVYQIHRDNQVITVRTDDPDVEVVMRRNGEVVLIRDAKTGQTWEYDTLKDQIGLADRPGGLKLGVAGKEPFVLRREGKDVFTVTRAPVASPAAPLASDESRIKGAWRPVAVEIGGEALPKEFVEMMQGSVTFADGKVTDRVHPPPALVKGLSGLGGKSPLPVPKELAAAWARGEEGVYHLDPTKTPKTIDVTLFGPIRKTMLGVYVLDGDTLKICMALDPDRTDQRPTDFATRPGTMTVAVTARRVPDPPAGPKP
jgi:uncharacterized protein (TIGR03067 family)